MRWLALTLLIATGVAYAQSNEYAGPVWSQLTGWLGAALAVLLGAWATRLEARIGSEARQRELDIGIISARLDAHISRADARAADILNKCAANTLALSELRLEMARNLANHPTKSDFERGLDRLGTQVDAMRDRLETIIAGRRLHE